MIEPQGGSGSARAKSGNAAAPRGQLRNPALRAAGARSLLAAVLAWAGVAVPAWGLDLVDSYLAAQSHDPILAAAQAAHTGAVEIVPQAESKMGASVVAGAAGGVLNAHLLGFQPASGYTTQFTASLDQPLFNRPNTISIDQAQSTMVQIDSILAGAEMDLVVRVAQGYFTVLLARDLLEATLQDKEAIALQLASVKRGFEVGTRPITDVTDVQTRYDIVVVQEVQDRGNLEVAEQAFEIVTGIRAEALAGVVKDIWLRPPQPENLQYWVSAAQERNPGVVQAAATLDVKRQEIDRTRAMWYPTLDLVSNYSKQNYSRADLNVAGFGGKTAEIGLQLSLTVWDGGMRNSLLRQANAGADQALDNLQGTRNGAVELARQSYTNATTTISQVHALDQAVDAARVSLEGALRGYEVGTRTVVDVLNARELLFQALRQLAASHYNALLYGVELRSAVGELSARDLEGLTSSSAPSGLFATQPPIPH